MTYIIPHEIAQALPLSANQAVCLRCGLKWPLAEAAPSQCRHATSEDKNNHTGSGEARCLDCNNRWVAVAPVGTSTLNCPSCDGQRGMFKHPYGPHRGDIAFTCNHCDAEHFYAVKRDGLISAKCAGCGVDQTMALWEAE